MLASHWRLIGPRPTLWEEGLFAFSYLSARFAGGEAKRDIDFVNSDREWLERSLQSAIYEAMAGVLQSLYFNAKQTALQLVLCS